MKHVLIKSTLREIRDSFGRWMAILAIVALGVGFFSGLKMCETDFVATGDDYVHRLNLYDAQLITTLGLEDADVSAFAQVDGVADAVGSYSTDALYTLEAAEAAVPDADATGGGEAAEDANPDDATEADEEISAIPAGASVGKFHALLSDINLLSLTAGRMPTAPDELVGDANRFSESDLGAQICLSADNSQDTLDMFGPQRFTLVGLADSPAYLNFERGSTSLGNGTVSAFFYVPLSAWESEVYTEVYVDYAEDRPAFSDAYTDLADSMEDPLTEALDAAADRRYEAVIGEAQDALDEAEEKLRDGEEELAAHEQEVRDAQKELDDGQQTIDENRQKLADGRKALADGEKELEENRQTLEESRAELDSTRETLEQGRAEYEAGLAAYEEQRDAALAQLDQALAAGMMDQAQYEAARSQAEAELAPAAAQLEETRQTLEAGEQALAEGEAELSDAEAQLAEAETTLADKRQEISDGERELAEAQQDVEEGRKKLADAKAKLADGEQELADARAELADAREEVNDIEYPSTYLLGRESNIGYVCFENDARIVDSIAKVFPVFFFLVAALVCMTTMTRMIDEQRTQIGVLKALGYERRQILGKYLFYCGSAAVLGAVSGYFIGIHLFPYVIWEVYGMMYGFADIIFQNNWLLGSASLLISLACCLGATIFSCSGQLREVPAQLIRPKAPQPGKRVLLERIPFIWNRLRFLIKVSIRNTFRYKKRFLMMLIGISGCTALLVTGLGIKDSIANVVSKQYDDIYHVDYTVTFQHSLSPEEETAFTEDAAEVASDVLFLHTGSLDARKDDMTKSINLVVCNPQDPIQKFIDLHNDDGPIDYPQTGYAVINSGFAERLSLKVGDSLTLYDSDMRELTVTLSALCDNYIYNYLYINEDTYAQVWGAPEQNSAFVLGIRGEDGRVADPSGDGAYLMDIDNVASVSASNDFRLRIDRMMQNLNSIVLLVVVSAGALAFIVLYNLTNINITERVREIATIKVLGFYPNETAQYVFRENIMLTAIASLVGLPLGKLLHAFVMAQVKIDMLTFDVHIEPLSYLIGVALTFLFAMLVSLAMQRKLSRISMTESLKSIE